MGSSKSAAGGPKGWDRACVARCPLEEPGSLKRPPLQQPKWRVEKPPAGRGPRRGPKGPLPMSLPCLTKIKSRSSRRRLT